MSTNPIEDEESGFTRRQALVGAGVGLAGLWLFGGQPANGQAPALLGRASTPAGADAHDPQVLHDWIGAIYRAQRDARALPPAAARAYALVMIAGYEAVVDGVPAGRSFGGQLTGLPSRSFGAGGASIHWPLAVNAAIGRVAVAAHADRAPAIQSALTEFEIETHQSLSAGLGAQLVARSVAHGHRVADWLVAWLQYDGYAETRHLPYTPPVGDGLWVPTPPNFGGAIEPYWHRVRPFALATTLGVDGYAIDPARPPAHLPFDTSEGSPFWLQAKSVYDVSKTVTTAQRETALYWRDNPDGVTGLPAGHWLQIAGSVTTDMGSGLGETARILALSAICTADGFTSCWIEKYRSNLLRPVTYIKAYIDPAWNSIVNSPAFPEYTSGHSVGSGAAAEALATLVGERSFTDYGAAGRVIEGVTLQPRTFQSFTGAADEAAVSRIYGGIHYPMGIENGVPQGRHVAKLVLAALRTTRHPDHNR